ncbi:MAG: mycofactocin precursor MftA [Sporichthyaceae bacterium]
MNPEPTASETVEDVVVDDLLVEDVSIDGMCGVY